MLLVGATVYDRSRMSPMHPSSGRRSSSDGDRRYASPSAEISEAGRKVSRSHVRFQRGQIDLFDLISRYIALKPRQQRRLRTKLDSLCLGIRLLAIGGSVSFELCLAHPGRAYRFLLPKSPRLAALSPESKHQQNEANQQRSLKMGDLVSSQLLPMMLSPSVHRARTNVIHATNQTNKLWAGRTFMTSLLLP